VQIEEVIVNGKVRRHTDPNYFQIELAKEDLGCDVVVRFSAVAPDRDSGNQPTSDMTASTPTRT